MLALVLSMKSNDNDRMGPHVDGLKFAGGKTA